MPALRRVQARINENEKENSMALKRNRSITRREFIKTATTAAAAGVVLANAPGLTRCVHASTRVRIGVVAPSHCSLSMVHASVDGMFRKNGVNAEIVYLPDMPDIAKGILSGDLQAGQLITPVFFAINAGIGPFEGNATRIICAQTAGTNGGGADQGERIRHQIAAGPERQKCRGPQSAHGEQFSVQYPACPI
ncbi:MAG TPA: twin-arginine translocation signal domain-containing protein [Desulfobacteraceae bacterium]|nr:twin-arginine translocation signal domain-containing protein [Desulfobacteraceae bacterium]